MSRPDLIALAAFTGLFFLMSRLDSSLIALVCLVGILLTLVIGA